MSDFAKSNITVYPNPAGPHITIEGLEGTAQLFNSMGQLIKNVSDGMVNIQDLLPGLYLIRTEEGGFVKFTKE